MLKRRNAQECYHDALYYRDEIRALFTHGDLGLRERALGEQIFWHLMGRIADLMKDADYVPEELQGLDTVMADIYYGNFSVFQSLPDAWAIEQLFPVMPVHRLNEPPTRNAILADVTEVLIATDAFDGLDTIGVDNFAFKPVPLPAAAWLLGSGLVCLLALRKRFVR